MLAARGLDPTRIQAMGRWRSPLVPHYATEALSTGLASLVERHKPTVVAPADVATEMVALRQLLARLESRVATLEGLELDRAAAGVPDAPEERRRALSIRNLRDHVVDTAFGDPAERAAVTTGYEAPSSSTTLLRRATRRSRSSSTRCVPADS